MSAKPRQKRKPVSGLNMAVIREVPLPDHLQILIQLGHLQPGTKAFKMAKCFILLSPPNEETGIGWHISISGSQTKRDSYPNWDEVAHIRYALIPNDVYMAMLLPPEEDYVNVHQYVFQLIQIPKTSVMPYG